MKNKREFPSGRKTLACLREQKESQCGLSTQNKVESGSKQGLKEKMQIRLKGFVDHRKLFKNRRGVFKVDIDMLSL